MTVSAAGFCLVNCLVNTEIDADQSSVITITTTAAADDMCLVGNHFYGLGDGTLNETMLRLIGCDRLYMYNNVFDGFTNGIKIAGFGCRIKGNTFTDGGTPNTTVVVNTNNGGGADNIGLGCR